MSDTPRRRIRVDLKGLSDVPKRVIDRAREVMETGAECGFDVDIDLRRSEGASLETEIAEEAQSMLAQSPDSDVSNETNDLAKLEKVAEFHDRTESLDAKRKQRAAQKMDSIKSASAKGFVGIVVAYIKSKIYQP